MIRILYINVFEKRIDAEKGLKDQNLEDIFEKREFSGTIPDSNHIMVLKVV